MKPTALLAPQLSRPLDQLGDRWSLWLLAVLDSIEGSTFSGLATEPGLSRRVLTDKLRSLEGAGFVERLQYEARPPRYRYRLTPRGSQLNRLTIAMLQSASGVVLDDREIVSRVDGPVNRVAVESSDLHPATRLLQIDANLAQTIYSETVEPLVRYDSQYGTVLVSTLSTFLELDASVGATAAKLYAHRHTIRYRLDRIHELSGLDVGSVHDRERLTLGLRALRLFEKSSPMGHANI